MDFSPDGNRVRTESKDRTSRLWDARSGKELCRLLLQASRIDHCHQRLAHWPLAPTVDQYLGRDEAADAVRRPRRPGFERDLATGPSGQVHAA